MRKTKAMFLHDLFQKNDFIKNNQKCIKIILKYMMTKAPSWREVANFVNFLNHQFECYELSDFTKKAASEELGNFLIALIQNFINSPTLQNYLPELIK